MKFILACLLFLLPSSIKVLVLKVLGYKIGKKVKIGFLSFVKFDELEMDDCSILSSFTFISVKELKLGKRAKIDSFTFIDTNKVVIGNDSIIMSQVGIGGLKTKNSEIIIGKRVKVFPFSFLNPTEQIIIEDDVGIGGANYIFTHGSWQSILEGFPVTFGKVHIKKGTWFPWRVFVMPNVTVGENCTIGAGSIINKDIPDNSLAVGSPAKVISSNGEYRKVLSSKEKEDIIKDIIIEMYEYLKYEKENVSLLDFDSNIGFKWDDKSIIFYQDGNSLNSFEITRLIIIYFNRPLDYQFNLYFDLINKESKLSSDKKWLFVKNYLSRFGIRFEIIE
jgi:acetyltransferase-like isoleucine patch superfamily enzyme